MKSDKGFDESEKILNQLEAKIHREYAQASKEVADKATAYFNRFAAKDEKMREQYEAGKITKKEYTEWRKNQMATGKRYIALRDTLAKDLTNTDRIAMKYVNDRVIDVYALNMNYGTYLIEKESRINTSFTLYNHAAVERLIKDNPKMLPSPKVDIPKDLRWNQQHIQSAITQGILQGKSIPAIAKDLQRVTGMDENAAIRNARTAMTGAQNAGRLDSINRAKARGIGVKKGWLSTLDNVTRDSHVDLDGEVVEPDKTFSNGLMYPGDASGRPEEVYNCRCRLTTEYDKYKTDWSNPANRNVTKLGNMSYQEWKDKHKNKQMVAKSSASKVVIQNNLVKPVRPTKPNEADYATEAEYNKAYDEWQEKREQYKEELRQYNEQKDELINSWINQDKKYNTSDDLIAWAKDRNVLLEGNIENMLDNRLYDDVLNTLDEMFVRFPEVKEYQDAFRTWRLNYVNTGEYFAEASAGLNLGWDFKDAEAAYGSAIRMQAEEFTTRADGTLAAFIRHEYGHNADGYCRSKFSTIDSTYEWKTSGKLERRQAAREQYDKELIELTMKHGSEYSRTNTLEAFAEGFSEYTSNPNSEYGKAFGEFFERWYYANPIE